MENCHLTKELLKEFLERIKNDEFQISNNIVEIGDYVIEFKKKNQTIETNYDNSQELDNLESPKDLALSQEYSNISNTSSESSINTNLNQNPKSKNSLVLNLLFQHMLPPP